MEDPLLNPIEGGGGSVREDEDGLGPFSPPPLGLETDPFYAFRDELAHTVKRVLARVVKLRLMNNADEILGEVASIRKALASLRENISHLERLVSHVERKRNDFAHLSDEDIVWRRKFMKTLQTKFKQMETDVVNAESTAIQMNEEARRQLRLAMDAKSKAAVSPIKPTSEDDYDSNTNRFMQEQMLKDQDESLTEISSSLNRLQAAGTDMYHEIESQNALLDNVNDEALGLTGKMDGALSRLDKFLQTSSRGKTVSILFLLLVLLVEIIILSVI